MAVGHLPWSMIDSPASQARRRRWFILTEPQDSGQRGNVDEGVTQLLAIEGRRTKESERERERE